MDITRIFDKAIYWEGREVSFPKPVRARKLGRVIPAGATGRIVRRFTEGPAVRVLVALDGVLGGEIWRDGADLDLLGEDRAIVGLGAA